jgi:uncharacterized protein
MNQNNEQEAKTATASSREASSFRSGSFRYLHIPAIDVHQSATFYERVFGWNIRRRDSEHASFDDGSGHVSGAWMTDMAISREPGLLPYIYVEHVDETIRQIEAQGGEVVKGPYPEGNLWVATFRDPAGNVLGIWQEGSR